MRDVTDKKDVFLCHTSADKERFVHPFMKELDKRGISYWIDEAEIEWGDLIPQKIDIGFRISKYVLVFLSEDFIGRNWPESELASALSKENAKGEKVVLPIIIGNKEVIFERWPLLRGKHCKFWREGIPSIVAQLNSMLRRSKEDKYVSTSVLASKDVLLRELVSYGEILYSMREMKDTPSNLIFLLNNILRILMANYKVFIKEDVTDISKILQNELQLLSSPRSAFHRAFPKDLKRLNWSVNEVQEIVVDINSFLKKSPSSGSTKQTITRLLNLYNLCKDLLTMEEPSDIRETKQLLAQGESDHLEFKSSMRWDIEEGRVNKELEKAIAKTVAGFMNRKGGTLVIGVDDQGNVIGLEKDLATFGDRELRRLDIYERTFDQVVSNRLGGRTQCLLIDREFREIDGNDVFIATVKKSAIPVYFTDGDEVKFFVRIGKATRLFNIREAIEYYKIHFASNKGD